MGHVGLGHLIPLLTPTLPIAISFFTFMAVSYVVDVYRGTLEVATPIDVATYLSFFPHLVAGPIVRGGELLPQLRRPRDPHDVDLSRAALLIMGGLFKKVVVSSYVSTNIVNPVFASPHAHSAPEVLFAVWGYAVQIYADFSGYTDIAIGIALLLGIRFPVNFDAPYTARNLQDFWRRWHITLSRWLRDYLYIPLGGNRGSTLMTSRNIMITMVLGRPVARGELDLRRLGGAARDGSGGGAPPAHLAGAPRPSRGGRRHPRTVAPAVPDVPVRLARLALLQRVVDGERVRDARPARLGLGAALPARHPAARGHDRRDDRRAVRPVTVR